VQLETTPSKVAELQVGELKIAFHYPFCTEKCPPKKINFEGLNVATISLRDFLFSLMLNTFWKKV